MADREACLVDVYHTLVSSDFPAYMAEMAEGAGITAEAWADGYRQFGLAFRLGQVSKAEGFARILRAAGVEPRPDLVRALVDLDLELLVRNSPPYDDALPFLRALRGRGINIAIVSNCSEHTRDLLEAIGVAALADTLVLSYEVGVQKHPRSTTTRLTGSAWPPGAPCSSTISRHTARPRPNSASPRCRSCGATRTGRCRPRTPPWCGP